MTALAASASALTRLTLVQASEAVRKGEVTSVSLTQAALDAFAAGDRTINASIALDREEALETAEGLDRLRKAGRLLGVLHGVPLAHKDMYYRSGKLCTCGSKIRKSFRPSYTATAISRLENAGSITIGTLNMAEFARTRPATTPTSATATAPARGLLHRRVSSGSGAAVATRFIYGALGSDTGGSIRLPATMCGITGIKGTQTRVSRYGAMPLSFSADNVGPLARTARDCARLLGTIAGHDPHDPTSSAEPVPDYEASLDGDIRGLVIGVPTNFFFDGVDPEVQKAFDAAMQVLEARGAKTLRLELPHMDAVNTRLRAVPRGGATIRAVNARTGAGLFHPSGGRLYAGTPFGCVLPGSLVAAVRSRAFGKRVRQVPLRHANHPHEGADPCRYRHRRRRARRGLAFGAIGASHQAINYLGLPSVSVPCGVDSNKLTIGRSWVAPLVRPGSSSRGRHSATPVARRMPSLA
jgi:aspartyl-tRNA(Asn)/glutamyl-tRNA(Gln) amidotransferase subunit A